MKETFIYILLTTPITCLLFYIAYTVFKLTEGKTYSKQCFISCLALVVYVILLVAFCGGD